jgi:hypothetical protein
MRRLIIIGALAVVIVMDVERVDTGQHVFYSLVSEPDNLPLIQDYGPNAQLRYHFFYHNPGGTSLMTDYFESLDELEDALETLNIDPTDEEQTRLILKCIRAGCPGCA